MAKTDQCGPAVGGKQMVNIAIVEDSIAEAERLLEYLDRYASENGEQFSYKHYTDAGSFLDERTRTYDIVFLDIMLPGVNGMEAAQRLRRSNTQTVIIFVTNMTSYAIKGYEVDALDYIVKPISYKRVVFKLRKALQIVSANEDILLIIRDKGGTVQISSNEIYYVEVRKHKLTYHTVRGEYSELGSMKVVKETLASHNFVCCNACYLVNMKYIFCVKGFMLKMTNGDELKISQPKRKGFMDDLANYLGQGK